jgi:GSH-dependent disulfide-bond oxidoreductase
LVADQYTIADMATVPWIVCADVFYGAGEKLELKKFKNVDSWVKRILARPKTEAGMNVGKIIS